MHPAIKFAQYGARNKGPRFSTTLLRSTREKGQKWIGFLTRCCRWQPPMASRCKPAPPRWQRWPTTCC